MHPHANLINPPDGLGKPGHRTRRCRWPVVSSAGDRDSVGDGGARRVRRVGRPGQGAADAELHALDHALPRRGRAGAQEADRAGCSAAFPLADRAAFLHAARVLWRNGGVPRGAVRGRGSDRSSRVRGVAAAGSAAALRGADHERRLVGLRGRGRDPPGRTDPARVPRRVDADHARLGDRSGSVETADRDHLSDRAQGRHRPRSVRASPSRPTSASRISSCARASAGRCASTRGSDRTGWPRSSPTTQTSLHCPQGRPSSTSAEGLPLLRSRPRRALTAQRPGTSRRPRRGRRRPCRPGSRRTSRATASRRRTGRCRSCRRRAGLTCARAVAVPAVTTARITVFSDDRVDGLIGLGGCRTGCSGRRSTTAPGCCRARPWPRPAPSRTR